MREEGRDILRLHGEPFRALARIPDEIETLPKLRVLNLENTSVVDLSPLTTLKSLKFLWLNKTAVADLSPIAGNRDLRTLQLTGSRVTDLRPLRDLSGLAKGADGGFQYWNGLHFRSTPVTTNNAELARLAEIENSQTRTRETLAYLKTLPPWPEPLDTLDGPILTVEAVLKSQSPLGWRFSPTDGAMQVYAEAAPTTAMQEQLAKMSGERAQALKKALAGANHGLRGEALQEASRFADLMDDGSRPLSVRSVELWGSLVALGGLLDGNDVGRAQGRDPLDLLSVEQRAALQTLLQIAGNFVRSYPDVKALDDSAGGFLRRSITVEMVGAMIEAALRAAYVTPGSAALMQHVAAIGGTEGAQADKAASVSVRGIANLIQTAALFAGKGSIKLAGAAALGAAGYVGKEAADHYDLDKAAFAYVELIRDKVGPFLSNMPPDETAVLQSALNDAEAQLNERARISTRTDDPEAHEQGRKRDGNPSTGLNKS